MSISSLSISSIVQHTIDNSSTYVYKHFEFIFAAFATLINAYLTKSLPPIHPNLTGHQSCENFVFYTNFVNCTGNFCLLHWHYAHCFSPYYAQNYAGTIGSSLDGLMCHVAT